MVNALVVVEQVEVTALQFHSPTPDSYYGRLKLLVVDMKALHVVESVVSHERHHGTGRRAYLVNRRSPTHVGSIGV